MPATSLRSENLLCIPQVRIPEWRAPLIKIDILLELNGEIMRGYGFGLIGDIIIGIIGAFIGDWLLPRLGIHLGVGLLAAIINATIGAVVLLLIIRLVRGSGGWGWRRGYGRRL